MKHGKERESGQVLVILMIGIVALLGFAALAVDGGMYFADRRYDQNVADSSALSGARSAASSLEAASVGKTDFACDNGDVLAAIAAAEAAAISQAAVNNFTIDTDISDQHGVQVSCEDAGGETGKYLDVQVWISSETQSSFAHLIFDGKLENSVEAITRLEPGPSGPFADGYAILALRHNCGNQNEGGVTSDGSTRVDVLTGGIYSNACLRMNGSGDIYANDGGAQYYTEYIKHGASGNFVPEPVPIGSLIILNVPPPDCFATGMTDQNSPKKGGNISPGRYNDKLSLTNKNTLSLAPGLYCLYDGVKFTGGTVQVGSADMSEGVTIYLVGGDFDVAGGVEIQLRAPQGEPEDVAPALPGMLLFMAEENSGTIMVRGNSDSIYRGTVYAPTGTIDVGGNGSVLGTLASQFIAETVRIHGNPGMTVSFEVGDIFEQDLAPYIDLYK